ncbi:thiol reductant ABC exporter subunit CydC [Aurantimonas sp. Leaf443]|uniref:thiol reductant ABC exporter subunit CydC n=1 Tax=Aurantimonas sp. Leaf443 TaxID=1736378 RepID=UPI0006F27EC0|nr:thiol reductant ABC exporter subunit CydC [Aurantimonas sp. Leaf443]KQT84045.1 ABC transporter ATP-binding protein [Aurantimonas sp. Leaf443]
MNALLSFRPLFARRRGAFALALCLSLATLLCGVALLGVSGWFLTAASLTGLGAAFNLFGPSAAVRGLSFLRILSRYGEKLSGHEATLGTLADIRQWLFRALMPRISRIERDIRHGDLVSRLVADVEALDTVFLLAVGPMVTGLLVGASVTALLAVLLPGAAFAYGAAMAGAAILVPLALAAATRRAGSQAVLACARLRQLGLDALDGHDDLVALGAVESARAEFGASVATLGRIRRRIAARAALALAAIQLLAGAALIATLAAGLAAHGAGALSAPLLVGLVLAVVGSFEAGAGTVRSVARLGASMAAAERLRELAAQPPAVRPAPMPRAVGSARALAFEGVSFSFAPGRFALRDVDLRVAPGECVVLQGPSGAGKSTLLRLALRFEDPTRGTVRVGGTDLRECDPDDLHRHVALLEQGAPVFLGTIEENLRIGRADAGPDELWAALGAARLAAFVRTLPEGLATFLGEGGRTLSAGQARRLCLARALLSPAGILLLDEPTSGLDRETERAFFADLRGAAAGRTVVIATHADVPPGLADRMATLRGGVLDEG